MGVDATLFRQLGHNQLSGEKEAAGIQDVTAPTRADFRPLLASLNEEPAGTSWFSLTPAPGTTRWTGGAGGPVGVVWAPGPHVPPSCDPHDGSHAPGGLAKLPSASRPLEETALCAV